MGRVELAAASARRFAQTCQPSFSISRNRQLPIESTDLKAETAGQNPRAHDALGHNRREPMRRLKTLIAAGFIAAATTAPAAAADISGAGATFPYPVYAKWADTYKKETNVGLNYQSIGSGGGIK